MPLSRSDITWSSDRALRAGRVLSLSLVASLFAAPASLSGCGGSLDVDLPQPLLVSDTYPASGATVEREHLIQLTVSFTSDLGGDAAGRGDIVNKIRLERIEEGADPALPGEAIGLGRSGYDQASRTLVFTPDPGELDAKLVPGAEVSFTIGAGMRSASGAELPNDVHVRFWIAEKTRN